MRNKIYCLLIIVLLTVTGMESTITYAKVWQDENTPISFKIEMLPWEEVDKLLPKYSKFTIVDVETGLQFKVQRRAGSFHADVQPLTKEDTKIMKKIYNGKWSWNRRAIIVLDNDQLIAASMHGMPHGAGALDNGFRGHFCVHFCGSITHRNKNEEIAHKIMILKAAGKLDDYMTNAGPDEILSILTVGINQKDKKLLNKIMTRSDCSGCLNKVIKDMSYFKVSGLQDFHNLNELLPVEVPAQITFVAKKSGNQIRNIRFILRKEEITDGWKVDSDSFLQELK